MVFDGSGFVACGVCGDCLFPEFAQFVGDGALGVFRGFVARDADHAADGGGDEDLIAGDEVAFGQGCGCGFDVVFFRKFDDECSRDAGQAAGVIGRVMERVVHDPEDVGGGRFADADFIVEVEGIIEVALTRVVEGEEIVCVGGRLHSGEE